MQIAEVLQYSEKGGLEFCNNCPWSPRQHKSVAFGVSCLDHGLNWQASGCANSMNIMRDPGGTTPETTGRLCAVHNSENVTDKTAQNYRSLWEAAVSLKTGHPQYGGYLKKHYATNAIMHGVGDKETMQQARNCCSGVLALQIMATRPSVVIAMGADAVNSLYKEGVIKKAWNQLNHTLKKSVYCESVASWRGLDPFKVFCTYHTSAQSVNVNASRLYTPDGTEHAIREKLVKIFPGDSIHHFMAQYSDMSNARHKGMTVLLNHWLDIGIEVRKQYDIGDLLPTIRK